jgi:hypothetical protein
MILISKNDLFALKLHKKPQNLGGREMKLKSKSGKKYLNRDSKYVLFEWSKILLEFFFIFFHLQYSIFAELFFNNSTILIFSEKYHSHLTW